MKKVRNAVRCFLLKEENVVCIRYKVGEIGYIDIPGGKIEEGETPEEACIREFYEETGMKINNIEKAGTAIIEYPDRIYNMKVFFAHEFEGNPEDLKENESFWISKKDLVLEKKRFGITYLLTSKELQADLYDKNVNIKFYCDNNNKILKIEKEDKER